MASMKLYSPMCANNDGQRATREIVSDDGKTHGLFCAKCSGPALKALTEREYRDKTRPTQPQAVRS